MSELSRRTFMKISGQGIAALGLGGMGFSGQSLAQEGDMKVQSPDTAIPPIFKKADDKWEYYYPGQYNAEDTEILKGFQTELDQINNRKIKIEDLVSGKLNTTQVVGPMGLTKITEDAMATCYRRYGDGNPLFSDKTYAKKTKYGDVIAFPLILQPELWPAMSNAKGLVDYMVVNGLNCTYNYYKPFYEGDTLYQVIDNQHYVDITPEAGSHYRTLAMSGTARIFNQKAELVAASASILKESYRRHKDPAKRNPSGNKAWESPDWWSRKPHQYTDKDWEEIIGIWKNEKYRGSEPLFWDDVKIGDEPPPRAAGPFLADELGVDMLFNIPDWSTNIKNNVLNPETFKKMVKNKQGIYVPPEYLEKKPKGQGSGSGMGMFEMPVSGEIMQGEDSRGNAPQGADRQGMPPSQVVPETPEIANRDGRAVIQNGVIPKWVAGMLINWIGDRGWLQRIGWDIMSILPGYPESVIPPITKDMMPALFDQVPYLEKVPYMRGIRPAWHALEGDTIICRAYVTNKYMKNSDYFVDLIFWCQTLDKYYVEEGHATVKLPKR
jgi:acyl dehydratase